MFLELPFRFAAMVSRQPGDHPVPTAMRGMARVELRELADADAPVAVSWRFPCSRAAWTRSVGTTHHFPVEHRHGRSAAIAAAAAAILSGADGCAAMPGLLAREEGLAVVHASQGKKREAELHERAKDLILVEGRLHSRCQEPLLVEGATGRFSLSLDPTGDWMATHPATLASSLSDKVDGDVRIARPESFATDETQILAKVIRKALILVGSNAGPDAMALAERAGSGLDRGTVAAAARDMAACLGLVAQAPGASERLRAFSTRAAVRLVHRAEPLAA